MVPGPQQWHLCSLDPRRPPEEHPWVLAAQVCSGDAMSAPHTACAHGPLSLRWPHSATSEHQLQALGSPP